MPTLAHEILKRDVNKQINMRGFLVGNPLHHSDGFLSTIDVNWDEWPSLTFLYSHGLVSHDAYEAAHKACGWEGYMAACGRNFTFTDKECIAAVKRAINQPPADMDLYGIDAPACFDTNFYRHTSQWSHLAKVMEQRRAASNNGDGNFDPCVNSNNIRDNNVC